MNVVRSVLLAASENRWLRERGTTLRFVRRAVSRFMPGEDLDAAVAAAESLRARGFGTVLTKLGENVGDAAEADTVRAHYLEVLDRVFALGLDCEISVKLTQLALDIDAERCRANVHALVERAAAMGNFVWIDMEQFQYVDRTLELYESVRTEFPNVGVCLQAYLYRTPRDLDGLVAMGGAVRLVKGAYREPPSVAFPRKADVDASFLSLARRMLQPDAREAGCRVVFGTHDARLIDAIRGEASALGLPKEACEFALLYGIQRAEQQRLERAGHPVRVLVSYGTYWFPWYMRRLAERPANVWFVVKSVVSH